jgi:hypothetical protein
MIGELVIFSYLALFVGFIIWGLYAEAESHTDAAALACGWCLLLMILIFASPLVIGIGLFLISLGL